LGELAAGRAQGLAPGQLQGPDPEGAEKRRVPPEDDTRQYCELESARTTEPIFF